MTNSEIPRDPHPVNFTPLLCLLTFSQMMQLFQFIPCPDPMVHLWMKIPNPLNSTFIRCALDTRTIRNLFCYDRPVDSLDVIDYIDGRSFGAIVWMKSDISEEGR